MWRYANASVIGTSHVKNNKPCQDANSCSILYTALNEPVLLAIVSDGAGSAKYAEEGSNLACQMMTSFLEEFLQTGQNILDISLDLGIKWLMRFQENITQIAKQRNLAPRDFACTLLMAIIGVNSCAFIQIGDGAIVISDLEEPDEYNYVYWPQNGEYENTTFFVTDPNVLDNLQFSIIPHTVEEVALFSDGIQRLALQYNEKQVFIPFFVPLFSYLRTTTSDGQEKSNNILKNFLSSDRINDRTDDDKTLIIATRRHK